MIAQKLSCNRNPQVVQDAVGAFVDSGDRGWHPPVRASEGKCLDLLADGAALVVAAGSPAHVPRVHLRRVFVAGIVRDDRKIFRVPVQLGAPLTDQRFRSNNQRGTRAEFLHLLLVLHGQLVLRSWVE